MDKKIPAIIKNAIATICIISILFFFFTCILYGYSSTLSPNDSLIKDAWYATATIFSGLATLAAAVIAIHYYNDWRRQHNKNLENFFAIQVFNSFIEFKCLVFEMQLSPNRIKSYINLTKSNDENIIPERYRDSKVNAAYCVENTTLKFHELMTKLNSKSVIMDIELECSLKNQEYILILKKIHDDIEYLTEPDILKEITYYEMLGSRYQLLCDKIYEETIRPLLKDLREKNINA